jgi:hypothetical protein
MLLKELALKEFKIIYNNYKISEVNNKEFEDKYKSAEDKHTEFNPFYKLHYIQYNYTDYKTIESELKSLEEKGYITKRGGQCCYGLTDKGFTFAKYNFDK